VRRLYREVLSVIIPGEFQNLKSCAACLRGVSSLTNHSSSATLRNAKLIPVYNTQPQKQRKTYAMIVKFESLLGDHGILKTGIGEAQKLSSAME
jgi:hypothetical protein